jgi:hypothetical protein
VFNTCLIVQLDQPGVTSREVVNTCLIRGLIVQLDQPGVISREVVNTCLIRV